MKEKRLVRFPNESEFLEIEINMDEFNMVKFSNTKCLGGIMGCTSQ